MKFPLFAICALGLTACSAADAEFARELQPVSGSGFIVDMKYYSGDNLVGERLDGYLANRCLLVKPAANALAEVAEALRERGLGLVLFDCYRPQRAVNHFVRWAGQPEDGKTKTRFYPREEKAEMFERGYIAERSGHSRGATVDLGLYHLDSGDLVDMGTDFDFMDERSATDYPIEPLQARRNRALLRTVMEDHGFVNYPQEWWHFTLSGEPRPNEYFDIPVN